MNSLHSPVRVRARARLSPMLLAVAFALFGFTLLLLALAPQPAVAQEDKQGAVIVQFDAAAEVVRPFTFTASLSGLEALALSGLDVVTASTTFGPAVCSIEGVGCPAEDCFCNPTSFWAYSYWDGAAWQSYPVGASSSVISQTGAVEGWRWGPFGAAQSPATEALAAAKALDWLAARQGITDGSYGGAGATVETLLAVGANDLSAEQWRRAAGAPSLAAAAWATLPAYTRGGAAAAGKSAASLTGAALCLPATMAQPSQFYSPTLEVYSVQSGANAWALLGALAVGEEVTPQAVTGLRKQALDNGGWEWAPGWGADTNATALALQGLLAAGEPVTSTAITQGLAYLKSAQNGDGGFAYALDGSAPGPSDANSTAYAVQALLAAGEEVRGGAWQVGNAGPLDYLLSLQQADGGFAWQAGGAANLLATQQVIPALLGRVQPIGRNSDPARCPALFLPEVRQ